MEHLYNNILYRNGLGLNMLILSGAFALLYLSMATGYYFLAKLCNRVGLTVPVNQANLFDNQIQFEIKQSLQSIVIFGLYGVLLVWCFRKNVVGLSFKNDWSILWHLLILAIWNEVHFYFIHKIMHSKALLKFHSIHHKSKVVTPFSTYSFHLIEAILLGTVMIIPVLFYDFEIMSLIIFPIYHLMFNTMGHCNVRLNIESPWFQKYLQISTKHNLHHTKFSVNFGFVSKITDAIVGTLYKRKQKYHED